MKLGVALPTCTEGMAYPLPFGDHADIIALAVEAERLGFTSVLANDHLTTQQYVRRLFPEAPPRYYEPLVMFAYLAARTTTIRLLTGVVVLPMREPVVLAKQVAVLDQLSGGRLTLGVGVGAYREEFEAVRPRLRGAKRADLMEETLAALRLLFQERRATYAGRYLTFEDVELYPKPAQSPLPIWSSGNADGTLRRAARWCDGWMPAALPLARLRDGIAKLHVYADQAGRDPASLTIAPQLTICLGRTREEAQAAFRRSQVHEHLVSLRRSTLRGLSIEAWADDNLIGTPDDVAERIAALEAAGVDELAGLLIVAGSPAEMHEQMEMIAEGLLP